VLIYVNAIVPLGLAHWLTFGLAVWADAQSSFLWIEHSWMVERKKHLLGLGSQFFSKKTYIPCCAHNWNDFLQGISKYLQIHVESLLCFVCDIHSFVCWLDSKRVLLHPPGFTMKSTNLITNLIAFLLLKWACLLLESPISSGRTDACGYGFGWKNRVPQNPVVYRHFPHSTSIQLCRNAIFSEFPLVTSGNLCHGATGKSKIYHFY